METALAAPAVEWDPFADPAHATTVTETTAIAHAVKTNCTAGVHGQQAPAPTNIELHCNGLNGFICSITMDHSCTIGDVKVIVEAKTGIPQCEQCLLSGSSQLQDNSFLANLINGSVAEIT